MYVGLLIGISVVLTRYFGIMIPIAGIMGLRLSLGEIPLYLTGIMFGPLAGGAAGAAADLIGMAIAPVGPYFPGFTLSAALTGVIPGLILFRRGTRASYIWLLIAVGIAGVTVTLLNTFWLSMMIQEGVYALLPTRALSRVLIIPLHALVLWVLCNRLQLIRR